MTSLKVLNLIACKNLITVDITNCPMVVDLNLSDTLIDSQKIETIMV